MITPDAAKQIVTVNVSN